jgi:hypothetical protein
MVTLSLVFNKLKMSKSNLTVALVVGENCDAEASAIRGVLEYFNAQVMKIFIGRPNDFIDILNGKNLYPGIKHIIFSFHGKAGKFVMPILGKDIYEKDEPQKNFGVDEIEKYCELDGKFIINTACSLGNKKMAKAFINKGCKNYIGAKNYIEGNSALFFVIRFYYELLNNNRTEKEAFQITANSDTETNNFQWFE